MFYNHDHLGNTRVTYNVRCSPNNSFTYNISTALDYYPYGKELRAYNSVGEKYKSTHNERDLETGYDFRNARSSSADAVRFNSIDPLAAQFPSWSGYSYVMGNPVRVIDPTGLAGEGYDVYVDGDKVNSSAEKGFWGRQMGLYNAEKEEASVKEAKALKQQQQSGWRALTKAILLMYVQQNYCPLCSTGQLQEMTGRIFESTWNTFARSALLSDGYHPNNLLTGGSGRNTVPDGMAIGQGGNLQKGISTFTDAAWFEVKAMDGTLYQSSNTWQVAGHIDNLAINQAPAVAANAASLNIVTTSGANVSWGIYGRAWGKNINVYHWEASYQINQGQMMVTFGIRHPFSFLTGTIFNPLHKPVPLR